MKANRDHEARLWQALSEQVKALAWGQTVLLLDEGREPKRHGPAFSLMLRLAEACAATAAACRGEPVGRYMRGLVLTDGDWERVWIALTSPRRPSLVAQGVPRP